MLSLSTHWNAFRHSNGESLIEEIAEAGFKSVELGYDLRLDLAEGVRRLVENGSIKVSSVHNYCPVPLGAPFGHPELFDLSSNDPAARSMAVRQTAKTIEFASEVKAAAVVIHCGYAEMPNLSNQLIEIARSGGLFSDKFEKIRTKLIIKRGKTAAESLNSVRRSLEELLGTAERCRVKICLENLPIWESIPTETEMQHLLDEFKSPWLGYWHDIGHGYIRQAMGFTVQEPWLKRLKPVGFHIHDVDSGLRDHLMPPLGNVDFSTFKDTAGHGSIAVLEPAPGTPLEQVKAAAAFIEDKWKTGS